MALANYYCGIQSKRSYSQAVHCEVVPSYFLDGVPQGYRRVLYVSDCHEETYLFEGVPESERDTAGEVSVREVGASADHTLKLSECVVDGSSGSAVCVKESVTVTRSRMSPHMWRIEVTHFRASLSANGAALWSAPAEW